MEELREAVEAGEPALERLTDQWGGLVKPDITFFGEAGAYPMAAKVWSAVYGNERPRSETPAGDAVFEGDCDAGVAALAALAGWGNELDARAARAPSVPSAT